jgi:nucleoside-diphosphate-sugar epimerase
VLVTGASGVVGKSLLRSLSRAEDIRVVVLVHRAVPEENYSAAVRGDIRKPLLGMAEEEYRELAAEIDVVVHAAAIVKFGGSSEALEAANIEGTRRVVAFALAATAAFYHVSTAYVGVSDAGPRSSGIRYAETKRSGEQLVRDSGLPGAIFRPSIVIGDSRTGEIDDFQGAYKIVATYLRGNLPVVPFRIDTPVDMIPCDVVADAITAVVVAGVTAGEFWITAGSRALSIGALGEIAYRFASRIGRPVPAPRFVKPGVLPRFLRSAAPAQSATPPAAQSPAAQSPTLRTLTWLTDYFGPYLSIESHLPSSLPDLGTARDVVLPDPARSFVTSLTYWARRTGLLVDDDTAELAASMAELVGEPVASVVSPRDAATGLRIARRTVGVP